MFKSVKTIPALAALLSTALMTLAVSGCGDVNSPTSSSSGGDTFTVTSGASVRRTVTGDGKMSFSVTGIDMDLERDKLPIVYFYDDMGYGYGRTTGGFQGELRNYKLKYYGTSGQIESETYHHYTFRSTQTYNVVLEWKAGNDGFVRSTVDGQVFEAAGGVADSFTIGLGYPPLGSSWDGAVYTKIVWPKNSKEI